MSRLIIFIGTVLLLVVVGAGVADYTRLKLAEDRALEGKTIRVPGDAVAGCGEPPTGQYFSVESYEACVDRVRAEFTVRETGPNQKVAELRRRDWDRHVVWFAFAGIAVVTLTGVAAWAFADRRRAV